MRRLWESQKECLLLQGQSCDAGKDDANNAEEVCRLYIWRGYRQGRQGYCLRLSVRSLTEEGQKEKHGGTDIQQSEDQIPELPVPALLGFFRNGQDFFAGEKHVHGDGEEFGNGLQGVDTGATPSGLPLGNSGPGNKQRLGQIFLSHSLALPQGLKFFVEFHDRLFGDQDLFNSAHVQIVEIPVGVILFQGFLVQEVFLL